MTEGELMITAAGQPCQNSSSTYSRAGRNELGILRLIHAEGGISRNELAKRTGLSAALVGGIVSGLVAKGLVVEAGKNSTRVGRRPVALSLRNDLAHVLGVDVGSQRLRVVVADYQGRPLCLNETDTGMAEGRESVIRRAFELIRKTIQESHLSPGVLKGIGVAHSGIIDNENGVVLSFPRPGQMAEWKNVPLRDMVAKEFGLPAALDDSTRMMAIAEKHYGRGKGLSDFLYISVSMGIAAAFFIGGELYRGPGGFAGEFGHMTVDEDGPLCSCGNYGCLEAVASCAAIIHSVRAAIQKGVDSKVRDLANGNLEGIGIEMVTRAAAENDGLAYRVLHDAVSHVGVALADVVNLLSPGMIILGGPLFRRAAALINEPLMRVVRQRAFEKSASGVHVEISNLGTEAAALGAARVISERILEDIYQKTL